MSVSRRRKKQITHVGKHVMSSMIKGPKHGPSNSKHKMPTVLTLMIAVHMHALLYLCRVTIYISDTHSPPAYFSYL